MIKILMFMKAVMSHTTITHNKVSCAKCLSISDGNKCYVNKHNSEFQFSEPPNNEKVTWISIITLVSSVNICVYRKYLI